jgi:hypothetical protein
MRRRLVPAAAKRHGRKLYRNGSANSHTTPARKRFDWDDAHKTNPADHVWDLLGIYSVAGVTYTFPTMIPALKARLLPRMLLMW